MNKTILWIAIFAVLIAGGYYCYKNWDHIVVTLESSLGITLGSTKAFRVTGDPVNGYVEGNILIAENETFKKRDPKIGEVVVYQKVVEGKTVESIGEIVGLPGQSYGTTFVPSGYYLLRKNRAELVPRQQIIWLITKKAL